MTVKETTHVTLVVKVRISNKVVGLPPTFSPSVNYILLTDDRELVCYHKALEMDDTTQWELDMQEEMYSLKNNKSWCLTDLPTRTRAL